MLAVHRGGDTAGAGLSLRRVGAPLSAHVHDVDDRLAHNNNTRAGELDCGGAVLTSHTGSFPLYRLPPDEGCMGNVIPGACVLACFTMPI